MNKDLTNKLFTKYPKIFEGKDEPITRNLMSFGFECGDGWYWLIDKLCSQLQWDTDKNNYPQVKALQVKEKFGTLSFYTINGNKEQNAMISLAGSMSAYICETCGKTKNIGKTTGWISVRCKKCAKKERLNNWKEYGNNDS